MTGPRERTPAHAGGGDRRLAPRRPPLLRRPGGADRADAPDGGGRTRLAVGAAVSRRPLLLHAPAGAGGDADGDLCRLAASRDGRRADRGAALCDPRGAGHPRPRRGLCALGRRSAGRRSLSRGEGGGAGDCGGGVAAASRRRALGAPMQWAIAAAAFIGIFFLALPYPLIVAAAALVGWRTLSTAPEDAPPVLELRLRRRTRRGQNRRHLACDLGRAGPARHGARARRVACRRSASSSPSSRSSPSAAPTPCWPIWRRMWWSGLAGSRRRR